MSRKVAVGVLAGASAAVLASGIYYWWLNTPPTLPTTMEDGLSTIGTARYENMPEERKQQYLQHTAELMRDLPDHQRHEIYQRFRVDEKARHAMRQVRESQRLDVFRRIAKADPAERERIVQQMREEAAMRMQEFREQMAQRRAEREAAGEDPDRPRRGEDAAQASDAQGQRGERRRRSDAERRERAQNRIETGNPQRFALMMEMRELFGWRGFGGRSGDRR